MKTISLLQPWATLVAINAKRIETRSWYLSYRGRLAIHASKAFPKYARELAFKDPYFHNYLVSYGYYKPNDLPTGAIIAVSDLYDCVPITYDFLASDTYRRVAKPHECHFGDYSPGRFAFLLRYTTMLHKPIPAKGQLGLWEWEPPVEVSPNG